MSLAENIRNGLCEVDPHRTPEQCKTFEAHVEFFDRVVAQGMARAEAERRELIDAGLMTEAGELTGKARLRTAAANSSDGGSWLMEMERESLPNRLSEPLS